MTTEQSDYEDRDDVETADGRIINVTAHLLGSNLTADAATGATVLQLVDAAVFDELAGGSLQVGDVVYTYTAVDNDADTVTIPDGVAVDAFEGDRVDVWDPVTSRVQREYRALVALPGALDNDDSVDAALSQALALQLGEGSREPGEGESVILELRGTEWVIIDAVGMEATSNILTGAQAGADSTSITSTTAGSGTSSADGSDSIAIGVGASVAADADSGVAIGDGAACDTGAAFSVALGNRALAQSDEAVAIGDGAQANGEYSVAIGSPSEADGAAAIAIGSSSSAVGDESIAIGDGDNQARGDRDIAIGGEAIADSTDGTVPSGETASVVLGYDAYAAAGSTSLGSEATCNGVLNVAVGRNAIINSSDHATALGADTLIEIGCHGAVAIGADHTGLAAVAVDQDEFVLGTANHTYKMPGVHAGERLAIRTVTADYAASDDDCTILADGTLTITLPSAAAAAGQIYRIKNIGTGTVTVAA